MCCLALFYMLTRLPDCKIGRNLFDVFMNDFPYLRRRPRRRPGIVYYFSIIINRYTACVVKLIIDLEKVIRLSSSPALMFFFGGKHICCIASSNNLLEII